MNVTSIKLVTRALLSVALLAFAGCASPTAQEDLSGTAITETVTETAIVHSVDAATRTVVLKREDGKLHSYKLGPQVINFDQITAGDEVVASLTETTSFHLLKQGPSPSLGEKKTVATAAKGEMPSAIATETVEVAAKVVKVDPSRRRLTLQYEDGRVKTFKTPRALSLEDVQPGDDIVLEVTSGMAIRVDKR